MFVDAAKEKNTVPGILPRLSAPAKIGDNLIIDVLMDREPSLTSKVTESPVEGGFTVSDHVIREAIKLQMTAVFTPTPVTWLDLVGVNPYRMSEVMQALQDIYNQGEALTVTLPDAIYTDMVMTSCRLPRNVDNGYCLKVPLEFTHVRKAEQKQEDIPSNSAGEEVAGKAGKTEADAGSATQTEIGSGMQVVKPTIVEYEAQNLNASGEMMLKGSVLAGFEDVLETAVTCLLLSI